MRDAGFGALFCNIGDYPPSDWDDVRERAFLAGIVCGPWIRTALGGASPDFDAGRLEFLIDIADSWNWAPFIVNSEKEIDNTGDDITPWIAEEIGARDAAISSEIRPYQGTDWTPLAGYPALPQNFPGETGMLDTDDMIRENWFRAGFHCVVITHGTHAGMQPDDFSLQTPYGLYTADDTGGNFAAWSPRGTCNPCTKEPSMPAAQVPGGAFDDCAKLETAEIKRPDGRDATAFYSRSEALKSMRALVNDLSVRVTKMEEERGAV